MLFLLALAHGSFCKVQPNGFSSTVLRASGGSHGYERDPSDDGDGDVDEARVNRLLTERVAAKRARDYDKADQLRDELRAMGVEVNDKDRCWRVRGGGNRERRHSDDRGRKRDREPEDRGGTFSASHSWGSES